jgi:hypothetical protein
MKLKSILIIFIILSCYSVIHSFKADSITASSTSNPALGFSFGTENLQDDNIATGWQTPKGKGEWLLFQFNKPVDMGRITIGNGFLLIHSKYGNLYRKNNRIKQAALYFNDSRKPKMIYFKDTEETAQFEVKQTNITMMKLVIMDIYPGSRWDNTAVSEISFLPPPKIKIKDLAAEYLFNGNAEDTSGYANHGEVIGAVLTKDRFGNNNSAYYFSGNYINCGNAPSINMTDQITVSFWIIPGRYGSPRILGKYDNDLKGGWRFDMNADNSVSIGLSSGNGDHFLSSANKMNKDVFNHIAGSYNKKTGQIKIYLNNVLTVENNYYEGVFSYQAREWADCVNMEIGRFWAWGIAYYNGVIDDVRVYRRELTALEIDQLYHEDGWQ